MNISLNYSELLLYYILGEENAIYLERTRRTYALFMFQDNIPLTIGSVIGQSVDTPNIKDIMTTRMSFIVQLNVAAY